MGNANETLTRNYRFGVGDADAPDLGMAQVNSAELRFEPEVYVKAQDGEGHSVSVARSASKCSGTFTGYVTSFTLAIPEFFDFLEFKFVVESISKPRRKGEFMEVSVEATGYAGLPA